MKATNKLTKRVIKYGLLSVLVVFAFSGIPIKIAHAVICKEEGIAYRTNPGHGIKGYLQKLVRTIITPQALAAECKHGREDLPSGVPSTPGPTTCTLTRCYAIGRALTTGNWGGGYATWPLVYYPDPTTPPAANGGHTNHTLWVSTDNVTSSAWIEVGYVNGYMGYSANPHGHYRQFYWAEQVQGGNYDEGVVTAVMPGTEGTRYAFEVQEEAWNNYKAYVGVYPNLTQIHSSDNHHQWTKSIDVGLETTDDNANIGHTYPSGMQYRDEASGPGSWHNWTSGAVSFNAPYQWQFTGGGFSSGHVWSSNYPSQETGPVEPLSAESEIVRNYQMPDNQLAATGGPFLTEQQAQDRAKAEAKILGNASPDQIRTDFTTYAQARSKTDSAGSISTGVADNREIWLVTVHGQVKMRFGYPGNEPPTYNYVQFYIDATTGNVLQTTAGPGEWPEVLAS